MEESARLPLLLGLWSLLSGYMHSVVYASANPDKSADYSGVAHASATQRFGVGNTLLQPQEQPAARWMHGGFSLTTVSRSNLGSPLFSPSGRMINCRTFATYKGQRGS